MKNSHIEWTDHTFNPWEGCTKVSPGCLNCYAETRNKRWNAGKNWGPGAPRRRTSASNWNEPVKWNREAEATGTRSRVFCASLADWLDDEVPIEWFVDLLRLIHATPQLDWLLLTKRPQNWARRMGDVVLSGEGAFECWALEWFMAGRQKYGGENDGEVLEAPENIWIGTTVEDQKRADQRIPRLLRIPARVRFLSCEPLLGPVNLAKCAPYTLDGDTSNPGFLNAFSAQCYHPATVKFEPRLGAKDGVNWVICGGESGLGARPMHPDWALSLRDQCRVAAVPFFFKQWGEWLPSQQYQEGDRERLHEKAQHTFDSDTHSFLVGKKAAGRLLDGVEHSGLPVPPTP